MLEDLIEAIQIGREAGHFGAGTQDNPECTR